MPIVGRRAAAAAVVVGNQNNLQTFESVAAGKEHCFGEAEEMTSSAEEMEAGSEAGDDFLSKIQLSSMESALQSLDSLSEQILQFIFTTSICSEDCAAELDRSLLDTARSNRSTSLLPQQRDALHASLTLMRGLLMDAQAKFKKMVDNNRRLATHIDGTIQTANQEVNTLRRELTLTNQKLRELSKSKESSSPRHCIETVEMNKIVEENKSLHSTNRQLHKEIENLQQQIINSDSRNRDSIQGLKYEQGELTRERTELLNQIQEMQKTIDDKEEQLRDFIREFELQMKENEEQMREADEERSRLAKERNEFSRRHEDLVQVVNSLRCELVASERRTRECETELALLRQTSSAQSQSAAKRRSLYITAADELKVTSLSATEPNTSSHSQDPLLVPATSAHSPTAHRSFVVGAAPLGGDGESNSSAEDLPTLLDHHHHHHQYVSVATAPPSVVAHGSLGAAHGRKGAGLVQHLSGSLSRAFGKRNRHHLRKSLDVSHADVFSTQSDASLFERSEFEKKEILENNRSIPMHRWKADVVLVWLEQVMHMTQYVRACAENIKSGKVLLELSESEMERCLNMDNALHRRKLFLAVEEFRNPTVTIANMSAAGRIDHWWVSEQWLRDVGLTQYASRFREHLIDGRTLASLSRKDLERHLAVGDKQHQESALRGVQLLQMLNFNVKRLDERRQMSETSDTDLLVWSCNRLIQWSRSIDLKEYSSRLREAGVHGALIVLDVNFNADDMANALGIPVNKATVRRHLASEFDALVRPAREGLDDDCVGEERKSSSSSSNFVRSSHQRSKRSLRSSLSRTIGRQASSKDLGSIK